MTAVGKIIAAIILLLAAIGLLTVLITVKIAMEPCSYVAIEWPIPVGKSQSPGCIKEGVQQQ